MECVLSNDCENTTAAVEVKRTGYVPEVDRARKRPPQPAKGTRCMSHTPTPLPSSGLAEGFLIPSVRATRRVTIIAYATIFVVLLQRPSAVLVDRWGCPAHRKTRVLSRRDADCCTTDGSGQGRCPNKPARSIKSSQHMQQSFWAASSLVSIGNASCSIGGNGSGSNGGPPNSSVLTSL